ncbi:MAG TPA: NAD(P)H-hydrate dehydratase [Cyclobacteriaceae bacterium]|nr:NAD(P)H-hydrate dehydratase [Cyclobacteriaceae bacterium]
MLKIFTTAQTRALDAWTIQHGSGASIDLMEHACHAFVRWLAERFDSAKTIGIVCGTGNNGGDGLGIARILDGWGYTVSIWVVRGTAKQTDDFTVNSERLPPKLRIQDFIEGSKSDIFSSCEILVDAIFGSGLTRPADGIYASVIQAINESKAVRVAVDIPSGLLADAHSTGPVVKAHYTVSFQLPKLAFMMPENADFVGEWHLVEIGLSKGFIKNEKTDFYSIDKKSVKKLLRTRATFSHKGNYGHALLIAGSYGKMGACVLAARGALRAGVGLLSVHIPKSGYATLQTAVPEAMVMVDDHSHVFSDPYALDEFHAMGIGPGLGQEKDTLNGLKKILQSGKPLVIDADAINLIGTHRELLDLIPEGSILTPHPKEFERLAGTWKDDFERLALQRKISMKLKSVVLIKGSRTSIAAPSGEVYFNSTGNPGMATGGSGDVLTGILTGLLAQQYSAVDTALAGVYLHGLSGDLAAREKGMHSLIASDLVDFLPQAFIAVAP